MTFNKTQPHNLWLFYLNQHQKQLHTIVVVLLSLYLIAFAAKTRVAKLYPNLNYLRHPTVKPCSGYFFAVRPKWGQHCQNTTVESVLVMQRLKPAEPVCPKLPTHQKTRLNLTLTGVVASSEQEAGTAIIENRGSQAVYGLGEKIEGTNATLQKVYNDRVIIKNGVRNETLMLDGIDYDEANRRREMQARNRPEPEELEEDTV